MSQSDTPRPTPEAGTPPGGAAEALAGLFTRRQAIDEGTGAKALARQHALGKLSARERIAALVDPGSFLELDAFRVHRSREFGLAEKVIPSDGVITGQATIEGRQVYLYAQDFTALGGSLGEVGAEKVCKILDLALRTGSPVISLLDSGGARIQEGIASLDGYLHLALRQVRLSGVVPQISIILGPCAGGATYGPAMTDFIIMVRDISYMVVTGPEVVKAVLHEDVTIDELGGVDVHSRITGLAHLAADDEHEAFEQARMLLRFLPSDNLGEPPVRPPASAPDGAAERLLAIVPDDPNASYDMRELVRLIADDGEFLELQPEFGQSLLTGFARLGGESVGIVANQPRVMAGAIDNQAAVKAARFVRFCDAFNLPVITLVDTPGFCPGKRQEHEGVTRQGAKMLFAYLEATVPMLTVVVRKAYGGGYAVMGSKAAEVDLNLAWPSAEIAVMGASSAASILYHRELKEAPERREALLSAYRDRFANPYYAAELGLIDDVIDPRETRERLIGGLITLRGKRVTTAARKHNTIPL